jgi:hypothetical protein
LSAFFPFGVIGSRQFCSPGYTLLDTTATSYFYGQRITGVCLQLCAKGGSDKYRLKDKSRAKKKLPLSTAPSIGHRFATAHAGIFLQKAPSTGAR